MIHHLLSGDGTITIGGRVVASIVANRASEISIPAMAALAGRQSWSNAVPRMRRSRRSLDRLAWADPYGDHLRRIAAARAAGRTLMFFKEGSPHIDYVELSRINRWQNMLCSDYSATPPNATSVWDDIRRMKDTLVALDAQDRAESLSDRVRPGLFTVQDGFKPLPLLPVNPPNVRRG